MEERGLKVGREVVRRGASCVHEKREQRAVVSDPRPGHQARYGRGPGIGPGSRCGLAFEPLRMRVLGMLPFRKRASRLRGTPPMNFGGTNKKTKIKKTS